jgi:hypothetical protein
MEAAAQRLDVGTEAADMEVGPALESGHGKLFDAEDGGDRRLGPMTRFTELSQGALGRVVEDRGKLALAHAAKDRGILWIWAGGIRAARHLRLIFQI